MFKVLISVRISIIYIRSTKKEKRKKKYVLVFQLRVTVQSLKLPSPVKADKSEKVESALLFLLANESSAINIFVSLVVIRSYLCHKLSPGLCVGENASLRRQPPRIGRLSK